MCTSISARAYKSKGLKTTGQLCFSTLERFKEGFSMRFKLKSRAKHNSCCSVWQPNLLVGIHGAGYVMFPCMQVLRRSGSGAPPFPALVLTPLVSLLLCFVEAFQQDLALADKH